MDCSPIAYNCVSAVRVLKISSVSAVSVFDDKNLPKTLAFTHTQAFFFFSPTSYFSKYTYVARKAVSESGSVQ